MKMTASFRQLLKEKAIIVAPGAYDGLTAKLVEQAGFNACYMTGAGTSAARGYPDFGLLSMSEMVENAGVMARSLTIPLIADADTGYGNELNITRTVREYEMRGVAAIHLEDQVAPKRCGHLDGKEVISQAQYVSQVRAAFAARTDPDFVIIARTDARAVNGLDDAIDRVNQALEAGADVAFVEAAQTMDELAAITQRVKGPCLLNMVVSGKTPLLSIDDAQALGYRMVIVPGLSLHAVIEACDAALQTLRTTRRPPPLPQGRTVVDTFRRVGFDEWDTLRRSFQESTEKK